MGVGSRGCRWVRDRLPLRAGGELTGSERREVERHLILCAACRDRAGSLGRAVDVLRAAAAEAPADPDGPSLVPALRSQIREARHEPRPARGWTGDGILTAGLAPGRSRLRAAAVVAVSLTAGVASAGSVGLWVRARIDAADAAVLAATRPVSLPAPAPAAAPLVLIPAPPPALPGADLPAPPALPAPVSEPATAWALATRPGPSPGLSPTAADSEPGLAASASARYAYDLDHGTPMGDGGEVKASY